MRKSTLVILVALLCLNAVPSVQATASEDESFKVQPSESSKKPNKVWFELKEEDTNTATEANTEKETENKSETVTTEKSDTKTDTGADTNSDTKADAKLDDTKDTSDEPNPFGNNKEISADKEVDSTKIADADTAKIAGIESIKEGFPISGVLDALGGDNLRLRSWPWGNVIGKYPAGTSVEILGESGEFYLVNINGTQGYMHKNYITTDKKKASGVSPYYPGDTKNGGALSKEEGIKASNDGAKEKTSSSSKKSSSSTTEPSNPGTMTKNGNYVCMDVPKLCQMNTKTPAPGSACGPTSLSMIVDYFGKGKAESVVSNIYKVSGCTKANGTGHSGLQKAAESYGLKASWHYSSTQAYCRQQLEAGKLMICHVNHHYVVLKGMDANGNVIINDPGRRVVHRTMSWSEFASWWSKSNSPMSCMVVSK